MTNVSHYITQQLQPIAWSLGDMCNRLPKENDTPKFNIDELDQSHHDICIKTVILAVNQACYETEYRISLEEEQNNTFEFGSRSIPSMAFNQYVTERLVKYMKPNLDDMIRSIILIDHLFTTYGPKNLALTWHTVHRLFALALILIIKFNNDHCYTNQYYARVIGITNIECNKLELIFLEGINFSVWIQQDEFEIYSQYIVDLVNFQSKQ